MNSCEAQTVYLSVFVLGEGRATRAEEPRRAEDVPVWIAAQALEAAATLLTFDEQFEHVEGVQRWPPGDH